MGRLEERQPEPDAMIHHTVAQHIDRAPLVDLASHALAELRWVLS